MFAVTTLQLSSVFAGRYHVVRCIATGGMGAVYEVVHLETQRKRALKVMHPHIVGSSELRDRFKREAKVGAEIDSEFIVDVFDAGVDEATQMPFLVMELLKGEELGKQLERVGRLGPAETISHLWQTALALDKTHRANIVHRDLKPENLFLTWREDGPPRIKVLDFGVAKFLAETGTQGAQTRSLGTPLYMAPEQFRGRNVSPASDTYALALIAYTMLVGEAYWTEEANAGIDVVAFALKASAGPIEPASARAARRGVSLSPAFDRWFAKATAVEPTQRFAVASVAIAALAEALGSPMTQLSGKTAADPVQWSAVLARESSASGPTPTVAQNATADAGYAAPSLRQAQKPMPAAVLIGGAVVLVGLAAGAIHLLQRDLGRRASASAAPTSATAANEGGASTASVLVTPLPSASTTPSASVTLSADPSASASAPVSAAATNTASAKPTARPPSTPARPRPTATYSRD